MDKRSRHFAFLSVILVALLASALLSGCAAEESTTDDTSDDTGEATGDPIVIGAILSLTGPYAGLGAPEENTIDMLVDQINADGGVNGRPIEVIIEDDATEAEQSVAAATKLIDQDEVVALIGATGSGQTMAIRDLVVEAEIPNVSIAGATVITGDFSPWVFQTPWSNTIVVPYTLDYIEAQGISKIAIIADSGGFAQDGVGVMKDFLEDYDIEVVAEETFEPTDTDMTAQLTTIKGTDAEAVVLWSAGSAAAVVAQNMAALEMDMPLFGSHGNARMEFIDGAGDAAEGFRFAAGKILLPEDNYDEGTEAYDVATTFVDDYSAEYGEDPNTFAGHAYDALMIIVEAAKTLDEEFTPVELRDAIEETSGFVGIGGTFTFSADDHNGMTVDDLVMYEVQDGAWILAE
jgi:branched-chain amino acid transport system substrate-binding protein